MRTTSKEGVLVSQSAARVIPIRRGGLSDEQLAARKSGIGSSDIAAVCGEDPWKSSFDVWLDKTGQAPLETQNDMAELGHDMEPIIARKFALTYSVDLEKPQGTFQHSKHEIVLATLDRRIVGTRENVECKNVGWRVMPKWRASGGSYHAPAYVQIQGQWQAAVSNAVAFWAAALLGGRDFHFERFESDTEWQEALIEIAEQFWRDHVVTRRPPDPDHSERTRAVLERLYTPRVGKQVEGTEAIHELAVDFSRARAAEKAAKQEKNAIGNKLRLLMGDAVSVSGIDWGAVEWAPRGKGKVAWAKVAKELEAPAELVAKHTSPASRTLTVKVHGFEEEEEDEA
jgi:putative phage-type endonuclease